MSLKTPYQNTKTSSIDPPLEPILNIEEAIARFGKPLADANTAASKAILALPHGVALPVALGMAAGGYLGLRKAVRSRTNPNRYFWTPQGISKTKRGIIQGGSAGLAASIANKAMTSSALKNFFNSHKGLYYGGLIAAPMLGYFGSGMLLGEDNTTNTMVPEDYLNSNKRLRDYYDNSLGSLNTLGRYSRGIGD
jgi:hypothetical protein